MLAAERRTFAFGFLIFAAALQFSLLQLVLVQARPQPQQQPPQEGEGEEAQQNTGPNELNTYGLPMDLKGISLGKVPPPTEKADKAENSEPPAGEAASEKREKEPLDPDARFFHVLAHAAKAFKNCTNGGVEPEAAHTEVYAFNTLFRQGVNSICPQAFVDDPQETLLRFFTLRPMEIAHRGDGNGDEPCFGTAANGQQQGSLAPDLGIDPELWKNFVKAVGESTVRQTLIKPGAEEFREPVDVILKATPVIRQRLTDIARTVVPECGEKEKEEENNPVGEASNAVENGGAKEGVEEGAKAG